MAELVPDRSAALDRELEELRYQLQEAEELISAIRTGAVDALAVQGVDGPRIFTLQGADEGYRTLIEQMNEGALLLSQDGTILYSNAALAALLGRPLEEVIGHAFEGFISDDFRAYWESLQQNGWAHQKSKGELPLTSKAGVLVLVSLSINVLIFNGLPVLAVIATDLSAQQEIDLIRAQVASQNAVIDRKNEELRVQEAVRLDTERAAAEARRLMEGIPHIAWTTDPQGVITYLNRRWFDYTGHDSAAFLPAQWKTYLHPDDVAETERRLAHCTRTGETYEIEYRFRNHAGTYRWMLGRALPSRNDQGDIIQWIGTCTDIHEHKLALGRIDQAQHQLREKNVQLTRANVDLDNFIYTASHDLKQPINNIEGLLNELLLELPDAGRTTNHVASIMAMMQDSVDRFKRTIEHLTEVTKLQKESEQPVVPISLAQIIEEVRLDLLPLAQASQARLDIDMRACPTVSFAKKNLRSVVYNLLSNALKYRSPDRVPYVRVRCRTEAGYTVLSVEDNGLGIAAKDEQKLFGMFQRFHDHVEGTGIGLYMVKKIMENAGGRIEVQTQVGTGSTFSAYFIQ